MTQPQLFLALLLTVLMSINGTRSILYGNWAMGLLLIAIPICGWLSIWMTA